MVSSSVSIYEKQLKNTIIKELVYMHMHMCVYKMEFTPRRDKHQTAVQTPTCLCVHQSASGASAIRTSLLALGLDRNLISM